MFESKSETKIKPVNGKLLIKGIVTGLSTNIFVNKSSVATSDSRKYYIAGTSVEGFNIGDEVIFSDNIFNSNIINDPNNPDSYEKYSKNFKELEKIDDRMKLSKDMPKVNIVEYAIIHSNMIDAIITK